MFTPKKTAGFAAIIVVIIIGIITGAVSFFAAKNVSVRGMRDVTAMVRVADGVSEDELFISSVSVVEEVSARSVVFNQTSYHVKTAAISESELVAFDECVLAGTYEPVQCTATTGTTYWVTLTEIE